MARNTKNKKEDLLTHHFKVNAGKYLANWFLSPTFVLRRLGIRAKLGMEDWLVIKDFGFAILAYDYEEGLKWEGKIKDLPKLVEFVKNFHKEHKVSLSGNHRGRKFNVFSVGCRVSTDEKKLVRTAVSCGLVKGEYSWELVEKPEEKPTLKPEKSEKKRKKTSAPANLSEALNELCGPNGIGKFLCSLYERWSSGEKEYEDFSEYGAAMKRNISAGWTFVKATKRPFGFHAVHEPSGKTVIVALKVSRRSITVTASTR